MGFAPDPSRRGSRLPSNRPIPGGGGEGQLPKAPPHGRVLEINVPAFKDYELLDEDPVPLELYDAFCRKCWPKSAPSLPEDSGEGSVSSASSDSSAA